MSDVIVSECDLHLLLGCDTCNPAPIRSRVHFLDAPVSSRAGIPRSTWTRAEIKFAEDMELSNEEVAELVGRTKMAVYLFRLNRGLIEKDHERVVDVTAGRAMARWTGAEIEILKETTNLTAADVAKQLDRSANAVEQMRKRIRDEEALTRPRPAHVTADVGYMTTDEFNRLGWAVHNVPSLVMWLRVAGYIKSGDDVNVQKSESFPLGVPPTWLAAEEISRLLGELSPWADLTDAAHDQWGYTVAMTLIREVETARAKWPVEDRPHDVQFIRCPRCQMLSLRYNPPRFEGDRIAVKCAVDQTELDEDGFAYRARLVEEENARRLGDSGGSSAESEPFAGDDLPLGA